MARHPKIERIATYQHSWQVQDMGVDRDGHSDELGSGDARGHVPVPRGPGLGAQIDWEWVKRHQAGLTVYE